MIGVGWTTIGPRLVPTIAPHKSKLLKTPRTPSKLLDKKLRGLTKNSQQLDLNYITE